ncbi:MAG: RNA pyrophosphohydrolase, partial [Candidatus Tectomicrobia bacterium]
QLELLHEASQWLSYELPEMYRTKKTGRGQTQKWFLFKFVGDDADIRPDQNEFTEWQWFAFEALLDQVIAFRRPVYSRLQQEFGPFDTAPGCRR